MAIPAIAWATSLNRTTVAQAIAAAIPLIGKDGDDVINNVTCALTGTGSISVHSVYMGNMALNRIKRLKSFTKNALTYDLTLLNTHNYLLPF